MQSEKLPNFLLYEKIFFMNNSKIKKFIVSLQDTNFVLKKL